MSSAGEVVVQVVELQLTELEAEEVVVLEDNTPLDLKFHAYQDPIIVLW